MVDACVAMLRETGWINFRMQYVGIGGQLCAVAALASCWYLVGAGFGLQTGNSLAANANASGQTKGINTTRVYNPMKQAQDHDPHGHFVRRWLPSCAASPDEYVFRHG